VVERGYVSRDSHVAFSGGPGGIHHEPGPEERLAEHDQHRGPSDVQQHHVEAARLDKTSYVKNNGGHPSNLAVARPMSSPAHGATAAESTHTSAATSTHTSAAASTHTNTAMTTHTNTPATTHTNTATSTHTNTALNGSSSHTSAPSGASHPATSMTPRPAAPRPASAPKSGGSSGGGSAPRPSPSGHHK
jgi:hypothetical protein